MLRLLILAISWNSTSIDHIIAKETPQKVDVSGGSSSTDNDGSVIENLESNNNSTGINVTTAAPSNRGVGRSKRCGDNKENSDVIDFCYIDKLEKKEALEEQIRELIRWDCRRRGLSYLSADALKSLDVEQTSGATILSNT